MKPALGTVAALLTGTATSALAQVRPFTVRFDSIVAPAAQFSVVYQLVALDSARAVVLDSRTFEISLITTRSSTPKLLSRRGDGPGESQRAFGIGLYHDSVWARAQGKFVLLPVDGRAGVTLDPGSGSVPLLPGQLPYVRALLGNRSTLVVRQFQPDLQEDASRRTGAVLIESPGGGTWTDVATLTRTGPWNITWHNPSPSGKNDVRSMGYENPFRTPDDVVPRPTGDGFIIVRQRPARIDATASIGIETYDVMGRKTGTRVLSIPPIQGGEAIARAMRAEILRELQLGLVHPSASEAADLLTRQAGSTTDVPTSTAEILTGDNTLWLRRIGVDDQPRTWLRIDLRTGKMGQTVFAAGCAPLDERQGRLWLTCTENDVPVIRRARPGTRLEVSR